jgi:hypothetical protein
MGRAVFGKTRLKRDTEECLHRNVNSLFDQLTGALSSGLPA